METMLTEPIQGTASLLSKTELTSMLQHMHQAGGFMRLDRLHKLVASVSPDMVPALLTQRVTAKLVEAYAVWPDTWKQWTQVEESDYLDEQVLIMVEQMKMIDPLDETGGRFNQLPPPTAGDVTYKIGGFGNIIGVDLRTHRSDRLGYFDRLGESLGRAAASRLHEYLYITSLQSNPAIHDGHSLFDATARPFNNDFAAATQKDLTYNNLRSALRLFDTAADASGEPFNADQVFIICGSHWREEAEELATNPERTGTANNEKNQLKKRLAGVVVSRKLRQDWYVVAKSADLPGFLISFFEGKEEPLFEIEKEDSSYQFEHDGEKRFRIRQYYGGVWQYPQAIVRGSTM